MKKLLITISLCLVFVAAEAQITKPQGGDTYFEMNASGLSSIGADVSDTYNGGMMLRVFSSPSRANRFAADMSLFIGEDDSTELSYLTFTWGIERHMTGSDRMSTYWGNDVGIAGFEDFDFMMLMGGLFTGFDYFIADGLYLGAEAGFRLYMDIDPLEIMLPGVNMNASFKLGYRF